MLDCRGLRKPSTEDQFAKIVWVQDPSILFIAKTWTYEARLTKFQDQIKWKNKSIVLRRNKAGGQVLFWKDDFDPKIETFSKNHIDTMINKIQRMNGDSQAFMVNQTRKKRHELWARLRSLKARGTVPWICVSDFNEISKQSEKKGGRIRPHTQMQPFRDVLDECSFMDMGFVGSLFTQHKHYTDYMVLEIRQSSGYKRLVCKIPGNKNIAS